MNLRLWVDLDLTDLVGSGSEALDVSVALEKQIENHNIGTIVGGGCAVDGASVDFEVEAPDLQVAKASLLDLLSKCDLAERTTITEKH